MLMIVERLECRCSKRSAVDHVTVFCFIKLLLFVCVALPKTAGASSGTWLHCLHRLVNSWLQNQVTHSRSQDPPELSQAKIQVEIRWSEPIALRASYRQLSIIWSGCTIYSEVLTKSVHLFVDIDC